MDHMTNESFRFFVDQVVRQYQELKMDIRTEVGQLRMQLSEEAKVQAEDLKEFKAESNDRFERIEQNILDLQKYKWYLVGAASLAFGIAEVGLRVADYFLNR